MDVLFREALRGKSIANIIHGPTVGLWTQTVTNKLRSLLSFFRLGDALLLFAVIFSITIIYFIPNTDVRSYMMNVSASFLFASIIRSVELYRGIFRQISFIRFFGSRIANNRFFVVYPEFGLNPKVRALATVNDIGSQALSVQNNQQFNSDDVFRVDLESCAASNDMRAMIELSSLFAKRIGEPTQIKADKDWEGLLEESFVSVGFSSNYVTHKWLGLARDHIVAAPDEARSRYSDFVKLALHEAGETSQIEFRSTERDGEIGLIVKFRPDPEDRPDIIWFFCAGLGGDGTVGSAIFLTRKWMKLLKIFGEDDFILVVRTPPGVAMHPSPIYAMKNRTCIPVEPLR